MSNITKVTFVSDQALAKSNGFVFLGGGTQVACVHPNYPGVVFQLVKNRTDVANCGAALIMFAGTANATGAPKKLVFGADVGFHLHKDESGGFPYIDQFPTVAGAFVKTYRANGLAYTSGNTASVEMYQDLLVGLDGFRWVQGNFGASKEAFVIGVHSRVARGFAWHMTERLVVTMPKKFLDTVREHPKTNFKPDRIVDGPNAGFDSAMFVGEKCLQVNAGNVESENFQHFYSAVGGEAFVTAGFAMRKFLSDQKATYVQDYPAKLQSKAAYAVDVELANVADKVELAACLTVDLPTSSKVTSAIVVQLARRKTARHTIGAFIRLAAGTQGSKEYEETELSKHCWYADESGRYPYGNVPYRPTPYQTGWGNGYAQAAEGVRAFAAGTFSFFKVPNVCLTFGPETAETDASDAGKGEVVVKAASLFQQLSPMAQPLGQTRFRTLNDFVNHECHDVTQPVNNVVSLPNETDPNYLAVAAEAAGAVSDSIQRDQDLGNLYEPFSRELYQFVGRVNSHMI